MPENDGDHSSRWRIATPLEHSYPRARPRKGLWTGHPRQRAYSSLLREGLATPPVTRLSRVGSYPTISPLPVPPRGCSLTNGRVSSAIGRVFSVALSLELPRVAVSDLPALWSPDFPPADACVRRRSPGHLQPPQRTRPGCSGPRFALPGGWVRGSSVARGGRGCSSSLRFGEDSRGGAGGAYAARP